MEEDEAAIDPQHDPEFLSQPFLAVMTIRSIDAKKRTFIASFHREGGITVEEAIFKWSDLAEGVEPVVGQGYRSVGTLGSMQIRLLSEEEKLELSRISDDQRAEFSKAMAAFDAD